MKARLITTRGAPILFVGSADHEEMMRAAENFRRAWKLTELRGLSSTAGAAAELEAVKLRAGAIRRSSRDSTKSAR
jgi:hypothetical protein